MRALGLFPIAAVAGVITLLLPAVCDAAQPLDAAARATARRAQIADAVSDIVAPARQKRAAQFLGPRHELSKFGSKTVSPGGVNAIEQTLVPLRAAFPDLQMRPKRILINSKVILTQSVISGTHKGPFEGIAPSQNAVSVESFQLHWLRNGEIRQSVMFVPSEQLRRQVQNVTISRELAAPAAPAMHTTHSGTDVKLTKEMVVPIYGLASAAVASRIALVSGQYQVARSLMGETALTSLNPNLRTQLRPYATALADAKISIENLMVSGSFIIAHIKFKGRHLSAIGPFAPTKRLVELDVLTIARVASGDITSGQSYLDESSLVAQLSKP